RDRNVTGVQTCALPIFDDSPQIASHESYSSAFDSDVRAGTHGDANIGSRQRRSVINAIASHGDDAASAAKFLDFPILVLRRNFEIGRASCRERGWISEG